jgi:hypothetical protein
MSASTRYALKEVEFVKEPEYTIGQLAAIEVQNGASVRWSPNSLEHGGASLLELAKTIRHLETTASPSSPGFAEHIPVRLIDEEGNDYPFSCIYFYESLGFKENRPQHEWLFWVDEKGLHLSFEHGKLGRRVEHFNTLSTALYRLAGVLAKRVSWRSFGDQRSRNGLLHKGQFYWQDTQTGEDVPVDNFIFVADDGRQLRLSGVSGEAVLEHTRPDETRAHEWFDDYAEALQRMADVQAGLVDMAQFGQDGRPGTYTQAPGKRLRPIADDTGMGNGKFVVRSIYRSKDEHAAPALIFKTAEGRWVRLLTGDARWTIQFNPTVSSHRGVQCTPAGHPDALRLLGAVLDGSLSKHELVNMFQV